MPVRDIPVVAAPSLDTATGSAFVYAPSPSLNVMSATCWLPSAISTT